MRLVSQRVLSFASVAFFGLQASHQGHCLTYGRKSFENLRGMTQKQQIQLFEEKKVRTVAVIRNLMPVGVQFVP